MKTFGFVIKRKLTIYENLRVCCKTEVNTFMKTLGFVVKRKLTIYENLRVCCKTEGGNCL